MPRPKFRSRQTLLLLACLRAAAPEWRHGYALMQATGIRSGTLYPALMRLADDGLLDARWVVDDADGRPRKLYRLSACGLQLAAQQAVNRGEISGLEALR